LKTNVYGTLNVLRAAERNNVNHFVNISTDKAASPTSALGHSKRITDRLTAHAATRYDGTFLNVRFGNVLGSRGSVIPTFRKQIAAGGPVTVTDPRMTRYFMSTDEAVRLVLLGAALGGNHQILALEMGEPVNIYALAERMVRLCGLRPHDDVEIRVTGLRPGEKLTETLIGPAEASEPCYGDLLHSIEPVGVGPERLDALLEALEQLTISDDHVGARAALLGIARSAMVEPGTSGPDRPLRAS
jgi:FlaA1/EpsC-like NDP-sugar epimerase